MFPLIETLKIENGILHHVEWHNARLNYARKTLFGIDQAVDLSKEIDIPAETSLGTFKCRVKYGEKLGPVEVSAYSPRNIMRLYLVNGDSVEYNFKWIDRAALNRLKPSDTHAEALIVKNGLITDTSYSNVALYDGDRWYTPSKPLLEGTCRARLIAEGLLFPRLIEPADLKYYHSIRLINALNDLDVAPEIIITGASQQNLYF